MPEETVIYRLEVMTIMGMIGDIKQELIGSVRCWRKRMAKRKKTPTKKAEERGIDQVLEDLLELGWRELKEKAAAEGKPLRVQPPSKYA